MAPRALIGRTAELAALRAAATAARRRRGRLLLVAGEAGIGKTALVEAGLDRLAVIRVAAASAGSGPHGNRTLPLGPLIEAARAQSGTTEGPDPPADSVEAVVQTLIRLAEERPLAIVLDDVQR